jgi:hypothetical protein
MVLRNNFEWWYARCFFLEDCKAAAAAALFNTWIFHTQVRSRRYGEVPTICEPETQHKLRFGDAHMYPGEANLSVEGEYGET